jgi:hypothetical protein
MDNMEGEAPAFGKSVFRGFRDFYGGVRQKLLVQFDDPLEDKLHRTYEYGWNGRWQVA